MRRYEWSKTRRTSKRQSRKNAGLLQILRLTFNYTRVQTEDACKHQQVLLLHVNFQIAGFSVNQRVPLQQFQAGLYM